MRWQFVRSGAPAKPDAAAELAVPHPASVARKPLRARPVGQFDRRAFRLAVDESGQECRGVLRDLFELLLGRGLAANVVARPAALERRHVRSKIALRWPDELHRLAHLKNQNSISEVSTSNRAACVCFAAT